MAATTIEYWGERATISAGVWTADSPHLERVRYAADLVTIGPGGDPDYAIALRVLEYLGSGEIVAYVGPPPEPPGRVY